MAVPSLEPRREEAQTDRHPLLMEQSSNHNVDQEHCVDIRTSVASSSVSHNNHPSDLDVSNTEQPSSSMQAQISQSSSSSSPTVSSTSNSRNGHFLRRGADGYGRRSRSPLNSGLWISIELVVTMCQIIASIVVLSLSRHENPQAPLFAWVVGYASGCVATLPLLYWRYLHRNNQGSEQESTNGRQSSSQSNPPSDSAYISIPIPQAQEGEDHHASVRSRTGFGRLYARLNVLVDHFKMALDCFFAVWFVVGNVWIFGGHSSASEAPILYRLCIVFLTFSCIGYAMPFILCATICCCLPCIISILGFREDLGHGRGATPESINALPTYKFKLKKGKNREGTEVDAEGVGEGGVLAAGTDKERIISGEDAICSICLAKYGDNEELRELPCLHFFHVECVDKWLKINASCPLCKREVGECVISTSGTNSGPRQGERRVGNGSTGDAVPSGVF
ncbi:E3 ubiquitin-protein ligase At1g63170-like [Aristolochia californica]|uniref:E3 ubiquitin-protein ligase At1g63170-like n=1 Tax=Aristolochia californica TaxID=171875 RepID=UPI0035D55274